MEINRDGLVVMQNDGELKATNKHIALDDDKWQRFKVVVKPAGSVYDVEVYLNGTLYAIQVSTSQPAALLTIA